MQSTYNVICKLQALHDNNIAHLQEKKKLNCVLDWMNQVID